MINSILSGSLYNNSTYTNLYSNNNTNKNNTSDLLSNYASIKNGSYKKMLNNYYANIYNKDNTSNNTSINNTTASDNLLKIKDSTKDLKSSIRALNVATSNADITENTSTDETLRKSLITSVKSFVEKYNSVIDESSKADNTSILNTTLSMTKMTRYNSVSLNGIGITLDKNNKLSVDENKLKVANIKDIKNLFSNRDSYSTFISEKADKLNSIATKEFTKVTAKESLTYYSGYFNNNAQNSSLLGNYLNAFS